MDKSGKGGGARAASPRTPEGVNDTMGTTERPIRVFLADSSGESVELLRSVLEQENDISVVGTACRGDEAIRLFPESGADLLLCELLLPGLDGLSLLRRLRSAGALPHAIVLSGFYNDRVARSVSAVAEFFLPKPCSVVELLRHIRESVRGTERILLADERAAVRRSLQLAGVMPHLDGFHYLASALERTWADPAMLHGVTKSLYRDIAREFGTTPACVERSMRSAIRQAWERMDENTRTRIFGPQASLRERAPSNVPFLTAMTAFLDDWKASFCPGGNF